MHSLWSTDQFPALVHRPFLLALHFTVCLCGRKGSEDLRLVCACAENSVNSEKISSNVGHVSRRFELAEMLWIAREIIGLDQD